MRVTIGQINTTNGDYEGNVEKILRAIEQARRERSDLVVFPEVSVQGYTSLDWFLDRDIAESALKPLEKIIPATRGLTAVVGTVRPTGETHGRKLFNSAAVIRDGRLLGFADKTLLPEYDVFDDPRYFETGRQRRLFELDQDKLGVVVCEDIWSPFGPLATQAAGGAGLSGAHRFGCLLRAPRLSHSTHAGRTRNLKLST